MGWSNYQYDKKPPRGIEDWRVPYIGRYANDRFKDNFELIKPRDKDAEEYWYARLSEECEEDEWDKDERYTNLEIWFSDDNAGGKAISHIVIANHRYWSTTSDFRDLHSSKRSCSYGASDEDIAKCIKLLNDCTIDHIALYVLRFAMHLVKSCPRIQLSGLPDNPCLEWDNARVELKTLAKFIQYARSYPEVFYSPVFIEKLHLLPANEISGVYEQRIKPLLNLIAIDDFYKNFGLNQMQESCIARLMRDTKECCQIIGITESVAQAAITQRVSDLLKRRYWPSVKLFGSYKGIYGPSSVEWDGRPIERKHYAMPCLSSDNGTRTLCIMNAKDECMGIVTEHCQAYKVDHDFSCNVVYFPLGKLDGQDQVLDKQDLQLGAYTTMSNGYCCPDVEEYTEISVTRDGLVLNGGKYIGYVMELVRDDKDYRPKAYELPEKNAVADRRLFGLFLVGLQRTSKIMLVRELRDSNDPVDENAPF